MSAIVERSHERLTENDLQRLAAIARADRDQMFARSRHWALYCDRLLAVALCQGAALHYTDGRNGVKDLDVWTFFAALPDRYPDPALYRRNKAYDYGPSHLGRHPEVQKHQGRRVDLLSDSIRVDPNSECHRGDPHLAARRTPWEPCASHAEGSCTDRACARPRCLASVSSGLPASSYNACGTRRLDISSSRA